MARRSPILPNARAALVRTSRSLSSRAFSSGSTVVASFISRSTSDARRLLAGSSDRKRATTGLTAGLPIRAKATTATGRTFSSSSAAISGSTARASLRCPRASIAGIDDAFQRALNACRLLEEESSLGLEFATDEVLFRVQDRLAAPNADATYDAYKPALEQASTAFFGRAPSLERVGNEREPFAVRISTGANGSVADALARH